MNRYVMQFVCALAILCAQDINGEFQLFISNDLLLLMYFMIYNYTTLKNEEALSVCNN